MPTVFVSATSRDLRSYRQVVADWARGRGYGVVVQDEFATQPDVVTVTRLLREKIGPCDAVVHLAGFYYGFEPADAPRDDRRRSYTQLEYEAGRELRRQVFRFLATEACPVDQPCDEPAEKRELQRRHRERLTTGDPLYYTFANADDLRAKLEGVQIRDTLSKPQNLPLASLGDLFKGREPFIDTLRRTLTKKTTHILAVTAKQAIHGMGGVGKTRAAVEYAWRFADEYDALLFVTADSPASLSANLAGLTRVLDLPERDAREQEAQVNAVLRWLRDRTGWLLIVDNVDSEDAAAAVECVLKDVTSGHVLVTSRRSDGWGGGVEAVEMDVLDLDSAVEFLLAKTEGKRRVTPTDAADARLLAADLGGLALALEQAGAFIARHRGSFADYRARWKQQEAKVLEWFDERLMKYPRSVATTWQTSVDALTDHGRHLLRVLCWLAPDPIPCAMLEKLTTDEGEVAIDVETGLADLVTYSLLKWLDGSEAVKMHRLVQDVTRYRLPESERKVWLVRAMKMVNDYIPDVHKDVSNWQYFEASRAHAIVSTDHAATYTNPEPTPRLLNQIGIYLLEKADYTGAEPLLRRAVEVVEVELGEFHNNTAAALSNLAYLLKTTNRLAEAEPLMRRALAIDEKGYGPDHPAVALLLNNLAQLLHATNRLTEAEPLMRRVVSIDERTLGPDHPALARDLNNLAQLLKDSNQLAEAERLMRRSMYIMAINGGDNCSIAATIFNNLASLLYATNRLAEAEALMRRALASDEKGYGPDHPAVAHDLNSLASLLGTLHRLAEAEPLMRRALAIDERSFGPEHPRVASDLNGLASLIVTAHRLAEAEPLMRRALDIGEHSFGPKHPKLGIWLFNYARLLHAMNRLAEAKPLMLRAIDIFRMSLGDKHPNTKFVKRNYELLLQEMKCP